MFPSALLLLVLAAEPAADRSDVLPEYEKARAEAGRDADAHYRLALWCERHGLGPERLKHLALAVRLDPAHAPARGLMGLVEFAEKWRRPAEVEKQVREDEELAGKLADYNRRRAALDDSADGHARLAAWCEGAGLADEARAHHEAALHRDPSREASLRKLGYRKVDGLWRTDEQLAAERAEAEAQRRADRLWKPRLERWRDALGSRDARRKAEALDGLAAVDDPRAVPAIWRTLAAGGPERQAPAVQVLGQIDASGASRALALLAVAGGSEEVRRQARETLRHRDAREFADLIIATLRPPIRYEVRPVQGPGRPGELVIEGPKFDRKRLYTSSREPDARLGPGDRLLLGPDGLPVIRRPIGPTESIPWLNAGTFFGKDSPELSVEHRWILMSTPLDLAIINTMSSPFPALALQGELQKSVLPAPYGYWGTPRTPLQELIFRENDQRFPVHSAVTGFQFDLTPAAEIPIGRMAVEARRSAGEAQRKLDADVADIERLNGKIRESNRAALETLRAVAGRDLGDDRRDWEAWWVDLLGFAFRSPEPKATVVEEVPSGFNPEMFIQPMVDIAYRRMSCFAAGTLVRTLDGPRPIETLEVGDRVLTLDTKSGALGYNPVTVVHRNPPSPTFAVKLAGDAIVASPFHRFWKVGKGWVMARDLEPGDVLRTLDGPAAVEAVEEGPAQPVFNLDVAGHHDFFAGQTAALVHDNTLPDLRLVPFDAAPALATGSKAGR